MGLLNVLRQLPIKAPDEPRFVKGRECSKKAVGQKWVEKMARDISSIQVKLTTFAI